MRTTKNKIAIDIDGTIADPYVSILKMLSSKLKIDDVTEYNFLTNKFKNQFWNAYFYTWENKLPLLIEPDITDTLTNLSNFCDIQYVTCRSNNLRTPTMEWLAENKLPDFELIICPVGFKKTDLDFNYLVDDNPEVCCTVKKEQILFLFEQPWNKNLRFPSKDNVCKIKTIKNIISFLENKEA